MDVDQGAIAMTIHVLCPGASLATTWKGYYEAGPVIAVNRALLIAPRYCGWVVGDRMYVEAMAEQYPHQVRIACVPKAHGEQWQDLAPSLLGETVLHWDQDIRLPLNGRPIGYSFTTALCWARRQARKYESVICYGCDLSHTGEFDGKPVSGAQRGEHRWQRERDELRRLLHEWPMSVFRRNEDGTQTPLKDLVA